MIPKNPISVLIADDHPSIRYGITSALANLDYIKFVHSACNGNEVLKLFKKHQYNIVLMDITMPELNGMETTELLLKRYPNVKIIAISMSDDTCIVQDMLSSGASGYLLKNADREIIIEAIHTVLSGAQYISKEIAYNPQENETSSNHDRILREIVFLISHGLSSKQIADAFNYSPRTVEKYRQDISNRFKVKGVPAVTAYAIRKGIITDSHLLLKFQQILKYKKALIPQE